jgi:hypothetical protein
MYVFLLILPIKSGFYYRQKHNKESIMAFLIYTNEKIFSTFV